MGNIKKALDLINKNEKKILKKLVALELQVKDCDNHFKALELIYDFVEKNWSKYLDPFSSCSAGCSYCCHINIELTSLEAEYISNKNNIPYFTNNLYIKKIELEHPACLFLDNTGKCKIYNSRPLTCRMHYMFTNPNWCQIGHQNENKAQGINMNNPMQNRLMNLIRQITDSSNNCQLASIHSFFPSNIASFL
jgi:uncharacterized protein